MKLELKHLAPYLPYGLNILSKKNFCKYGEQTILKVNGIAFQDTADIPYWQYEFVYDDDLKFSNINKKGFKPILRPLSDLTKEIEEGKKPIAEWLMLCKNSKGVWSFDTNDFSTWEVMAVINEVNLLFKNHFDIFGLIEKGLAIDINTLPQNKL